MPPVPLRSLPSRHGREATAINLPLVETVEIFALVRPKRDRRDDFTKGCHFDFTKRTRTDTLASVHPTIARKS